MGTDSRLSSTCKIIDRYGMKSSILGVGRSDKDVDFITGTYFPGTDQAVCYPEWADGRKVVQVMIWRELGLQDDPVISEEISGSIDRTGQTTHGTTSIDCSAATGLILRRAQFEVTTASSTTASANIWAGLESGDASWGVRPPTHVSATHVRFEWTQNSGLGIHHASHLGGANPDFHFGPDDSPNGVYAIPPYDTFRKAFNFYNDPEALAQALEDAKVTSTRKYMRILTYAGNSLDYTFGFSALNIGDDEVNSIKATVSADERSLNGSFPLRGGDTLTMGFTASTMPAIVEGDPLFSVSVGQGANPGISYVFVVK